MEQGKAVRQLETDNAEDTGARVDSAGHEIIQAAEPCFTEWHNISETLDTLFRYKHLRPEEPVAGRAFIDCARKALPQVYIVLEPRRKIPLDRGRPSIHDTRIHFALAASTEEALYGAFLAAVFIAKDVAWLEETHLDNAFLSCSPKASFSNKRFGNVSAWRRQPALEMKQ